MALPLVYAAGLSVLLLGGPPHAEEEEVVVRPPPSGDLFPGAGRPTVAAATGVPFFALGEIGIGITNGVAVGLVGVIAPTVVGAGIRPRFRVATSEHTSLVLNMPMVYYPKSSEPGPGDIGASTWVLTRPELFVDGEIGDRWHVAGGMGIIAAASTEALHQFVNGKDFAMPPYDGSTEARKGFAGGIWNTIATRASYALDPRTHVFTEGSLVMSGVVPATGVGGPPIIVTLGLQHSL